MHELALFAGAGGGILGGKLLGWRTVCAVEIEPFPREVLLRRQEEGILEPFPIWDDVSTFDGKPWRGKVDIVTGGFPCQDISAAGKGAGIGGERSGLWKEMARIISEVRPSYVLVENSPLLVSRGLTTVLGDLAEMGYHVPGWGCIGASCTGLDQERERSWTVANRDERTIQHVGKCKAEDKKWWRERFRRESGIDILVEAGSNPPAKWRRRGSKDATRPVMWGDSDGLADGLDRIAAIGNGQVPAVVRLAWEILNP